MESSKLYWECGWEAHSSEMPFKQWLGLYNYEGYFSVVFLAVCDADGMFLMWESMEETVMDGR